MARRCLDEAGFNTGRHRDHDDDDDGDYDDDDGGGDDEDDDKGKVGVLSVEFILLMLAKLFYVVRTTFSCYSYEIPISMILSFQI